MNFDSEKSIYFKLKIMCIKSMWISIIVEITSPTQNDEPIFKSRPKEVPDLVLHYSFIRLTLIQISIGLIRS